MSQLKAKIRKASGMVLMIPRTGWSSQLFLEWIEIHRKENNRTVHIKTRSGYQDEDFFNFELENCIPETYLMAMSYVNANLPTS